MPKKNNERIHDKERQGRNKMRKYFEYEFNEEIKEKLLNYYNSLDSMGDFGDGNLKMALKIDRLREHIPYDENDVICDVGCADAVLLKYLDKYYKSAVGLDISQTVIERDKELNLPKVSFQTYDGMHIDTEEKFDKIFLMDVLEHAFDPDTLIASIYDHIKKGGVLVMQVPSTGWLSELIFGKYHYGHLRYYDEAYLCSYLEKVGFEIEYSATFNAVPWSQKIIHHKKLFSVLNKICSAVPHSLYPYYGSVAAVARK